MYVHCVVGVTVERELAMAKCTTVQQSSTQIAKQNCLHIANIVQQPPHSLYCLHLTVWITLLYMKSYVVTPPHHNSTSLAVLIKSVFLSDKPTPPHSISLLQRSALGTTPTQPCNTQNEGMTVPAVEETVWLCRSARWLPYR